MQSNKSCLLIAPDCCYDRLVKRADKRPYWRCLLFLSVLLSIHLLVVLQSHAGDAFVLPAGVFRARTRVFQASFDHHWDPSGKREAIGTDLDGVRLDSDVFSDLAVLERLYGLEDKSLFAGTSSFDTSVDIRAVALAFEAGVTDWLTLGVIVPVINARNRVSRLELAPGNIGKNPCTIDCPVKAEDAAYVPLDHDADPSTRPIDPLTLDQVQDLLHDEYDLARIGDWEGTGIGDIELGFKAAIPWANRLHPMWRSSLQGGLRLPTGKPQDPDNFLSLGFGDGQTDIGVYWQNDLSPAPWLRFNSTLRYTWQLPDWELKRVPPRADMPIASSDDKEEVWRNLGNIFEAEAGMYGLMYRRLIPFVRYVYMTKEQDQIRGNRGLTYGALEDLSAGKEMRMEVGLTYTTRVLMETGDATIPFDLTVGFEQSFWGRDRMPITSVVRLEAALYFMLF